MTHLQKSITTTEGSLLLAGSDSWDTSGDSSLLGRPAARKRPPAESVILPTDEAIPIGLIAKLSLSDTEKSEAQKVKEDKEEAEVSRARPLTTCWRHAFPQGWGDTRYFREGSFSTRSAGVIVFLSMYTEPAAATDFIIPETLLEENKIPDIVLHGLVTPDDVDKLFAMYVFISFSADGMLNKSCDVATLPR